MNISKVKREGVHPVQPKRGSRAEAFGAPIFLEKLRPALRLTCIATLPSRHGTPQAKGHEPHLRSCQRMA